MPPKVDLHEEIAKTDISYATNFNGNKYKDPYDALVGAEINEDDEFEALFGAPKEEETVPELVGDSTLHTMGDITAAVEAANQRSYQEILNKRKTAAQELEDIQKMADELEAADLAAQQQQQEPPQQEEEEEFLQPASIEGPKMRQDSRYDVRPQFTQLPVVPEQREFIRPPPQAQQRAPEYDEKYKILLDKVGLYAREFQTRLKEYIGESPRDLERYLHKVRTKSYQELEVELDTLKFYLRKATQGETMLHLGYYKSLSIFEAFSKRYGIMCDELEQQARLNDQINVALTQIAIEDGYMNPTNPKVALIMATVSMVGTNHMINKQKLLREQQIAQRKADEAAAAAAAQQAQQVPELINFQKINSPNIDIQPIEIKKDDIPSGYVAKTAAKYQLA